MITRRGMLAGMGGAVLVGDLGSSSGNALAAEAPELELFALRQKKALIKQTFRPPNFETPLADLRSEFTANDAFFVRYHLANIPKVDVRTWRLRAGGESASRTHEWRLDDLRRDFEKVSVAAINQCSGNRRGLFTPRVPGVQWQYGAMGNAIWTGVRLRDVLQKVGVRPDALEVVFDGADAALLGGTPDFVKSLPIERALDENTLIAFEMNGHPLPHWNGAPARLVVPGWTATYWVKHLTEIRIVPKAYEGFWMQKAYRVPTGVFPGAVFKSQEGMETTPITEMLVNSLITSHESGARLTRGQRAELSGWAWDNGAGIAKVEISQDGGRVWRGAMLGRDLGRFAWRGFTLPIDTTQGGPITVAVRATSRNGTQQPEKLTPNPSGYHHNIIQTLQLEVT
ncbi:oxidase [Steroidobacter agaridevorans]|uniref:Oxidase n=1 Tax=Steroidobacter agaridevorans TaxID=2695856 RepID=A0A829YMD4_9GAMM|nr:molybdopterin-dependent oxidoreductase [Steroidobacter agaridevorans]GFE83666.1 oxidase [Steroidobacter agaridevorans]